MLYSLIKSRVDLSMAQIDGAEHANRKKQRSGGEDILLIAPWIEMDQL
jgi:hypothetical protein